ncbi:MAG: single-stranded DNA-binding protein [Bacteroidales bacterium]
MSTIRNRVSLIGHLGNDPEIKEMDGGKTLAKINLATNDVYKDSEGKKVTETQWHNLIIWGPQAKTAQKYLKKGSEIAVDGKLVHRNYENKDGVKKYVTEIIVSEFAMLGKKSAN